MVSAHVADIHHVFLRSLTDKHNNAAGCYSTDKPSNHSHVLSSLIRIGRICSDGLVLTFTGRRRRERASGLMLLLSKGKRPKHINQQTHRCAGISARGECEEKGKQIQRREDSWLFLFPTLPPRYRPSPTPSEVGVGAV